MPNGTSSPRTTANPGTIEPPSAERAKPGGEETPPVRRDPGEPTSGSTGKPAVPETTRVVAAPPAPKVVPDEASLRQAVQAYADAISSGNRDAVRRAFPGITESDLREIDALKTNFGRHYRMTVFIRDFKIDGSRARVECRVIHNALDDRGKEQTKGRNETWTFEWTGGTWVRVR